MGNLVTAYHRKGGNRAVARTLIGGGGCIFIYSGYARLISFEINFTTKETSRTEPEYMTIHPPISVLAPALGGKSKYDRKLTELDVETTRIRSRVNGVSVYFSLLQFLGPTASPTQISIP